MHSLRDSSARSPVAQELADYAKVLKEMRSHFDVYGKGPGQLTKGTKCCKGNLCILYAQSSRRSSVTKVLGDYAKVLKEMQSHRLKNNMECFKRTTYIVSGRPPAQNTLQRFTPMSSNRLIQIHGSRWTYLFYLFCLPTSIPLTLLLQTITTPPPSQFTPTP